MGNQPVHTPKGRGPRSVFEAASSPCSLALGDVLSTGVAHPRARTEDNDSETKEQRPPDHQEWPRSPRDQLHRRPRGLIWSDASFWCHETEQQHIEKWNPRRRNEGRRGKRNQPPLPTELDQPHVAPFTQNNAFKKDTTPEA
jgi:hypothetical protein